MRKIFILSAFILLITSCKKKEDAAEPVSNTPAIEFVSITPSSAKEYQDKIIIIIAYTDGDGDLGENTADVKNLFLTDTRNNVTYQYRIPQLSPTGSTITIKGSLPIELPNTAITNGASSQSVSYLVYVKDRAGNKSNSVSTSAITVVK